MPHTPRAIILVTRSSRWIQEHRCELETMGVVGWCPIVEGPEVIEAMRRRHGADNVMEWSEPMTTEYVPARVKNIQRELVHAEEMLKTIDRERDECVKRIAHIKREIHDIIHPEAREACGG